MNYDYEPIVLPRRPASDFSLKNWFEIVGESIFDRIEAKGFAKAFHEKFAPRYAPHLKYDGHGSHASFELEHVMCDRTPGWKKRTKEVEELIKSNPKWVKEFLEMEDAHLYYDKEVRYDDEGEDD